MMSNATNLESSFSGLSKHFFKEILMLQDLLEIYKIYSLLHRSTTKTFAKVENIIANISPKTFQKLADVITCVK